ncbi:MAG TPA: adenylate/guanylate cyclase domain-containing protein [Egibacteraceae bacterium]|nr:adenylate/guanylate cyclase domain-containing protein [Egibacteraceae bacterium]
MEPDRRISVLLADDNLLVREGVRALLELEDDLDVAGVATDEDELVTLADELAPQVVVTDIRMPPTFTREGIEAAKRVRRRHPGTGVVILSQYDDPEYAVSLLAEGAAGYAYLLKDRIGDGDQLARAVREVAGGGSMLDPSIVSALVNPVRRAGALSPDEEELVRLVAEGVPVKAIAVRRRTTPADVANQIEKVFVRLADGLSAGDRDALERLRLLQQAIVDREEQGETLSRMLPTGIADQLRAGGQAPGQTQALQVTVLMSDVRGYSGIAERTTPSVLARQLHEHRAAANRAIAAAGGTVMQFVGDAVMAVFGAPVPQPDHAARAVAAARALHSAQAQVNARWAAEGLEPFGLGVGLSTGPVAAALLGSEEHLEYSLVGDTVNLTQRLQQWAQPGETVLSQPTYAALQAALQGAPPACQEIAPTPVKGRAGAVGAWRLPAERLA